MPATNQIIQIDTTPGPNYQDIIASYQKALFHMRNAYYKEGAVMSQEIMNTYLDIISEDLMDCNLLGVATTMGLFHTHLENLRKQETR